MYLFFKLPFLVANDLDGHHLIGLMIQTFKDLPKRSLPNHLQDFIAVGDMVVKDLHTYHIWKESHVSAIESQSTAIFVYICQEDYRPYFCGHSAKAKIRSKILDLGVETEQWVVLLGSQV